MKEYITYAYDFCKKESTYKKKLSDARQIEDTCRLILETDTVHVSSEGKCENFETGQHIGYTDAGHR